MKKKKKAIPQEELLSPEELALWNTQEDRSGLPPHDNSDGARAVRYVKKNPIVLITAIVILLALIATTVIGVMLWIRKLETEPSTADFKIVLGEEEQTLAYSHAMRDGVLFLDFKRIAAYVGMITLGSNERIKFATADGQYLRFENESELAVINGSEVEMTAKAIVSESECLVPYSFLDKVISQGITLHWEITTNVITVKRQKYRDTLDYASMQFVTDGFEILRSLKQTEKKEITVEDYPIDITPYLSYINPTSMSDMLILANKQTALGEEYAPTDLVYLETIGVRSKNDSQCLRHQSAYALKAMLEAMTAESPTATKDLVVTSSYRSYKYQEGLYEGYVEKHMAEGMTRKEAEEAASAYSSRPGESEHQTGLCFDFIIDGGKLDTTFEDTEAFTWLSENAHLYGFILRYPIPPDGSYEDPHPITGYSYEPWHYRFVGRDAAVTIYESGVTFEEYLELN